MLPRVYRHAASPPTLALARWSAVLWAGPPCALSHTSAAALWGMGSLPVGAPELLVPRVRVPRADGVIVHRTGHFRDEDVTRVGRLPVTTPVRTIVDLAGVLGAPDLERALVAARSRRLLTVRAVLAHLDELGSPGRPGVVLLRGLLAPIGSVWVDRSARMAG